MTTDPRVTAALAALRAEVDELRRRLPAPLHPMTSTVGGVTDVRTLQLGFAAETTGVYNATTGYPWKRLRLNTLTPGFENPAIQQTGTGAFEVAGGTGLASGTRCWLEPSPEASGYVLYCGSSAAAILGGYLFLCEVTVSSSTVHTVKRKTRNGSNAIVDFAGPVTYTQCLSTTAGALPVGTLVLLDPIPDHSGYYWITPAAYATGALPGLVSTTTQTFLGNKTVDGTLTSTGDLSVNPTAAGDYVLISLATSGYFGGPGIVFDSTSPGAALPTEITGGNGALSVYCDTLYEFAGINSGNRVYVFDPDGTAHLALDTELSLASIGTGGKLKFKNGRYIGLVYPPGPGTPPAPGGGSGFAPAGTGAGDAAGGGGAGGFIGLPPPSGGWGGGSPTTQPDAP